MSAKGSSVCPSGGVWQTCPVCFGKGIVPTNFYMTPGPSTSSVPAGMVPERCRSCGGLGIVR